MTINEMLRNISEQESDCKAVCPVLIAMSKDAHEQATFGKVTLKCYAGCGAQKVLDKLNIDVRDLLAE